MTGRKAPGSGDFSIGALVWPGVSKLIEEAAEVLQVAGKLLGSRGDVDHFDGSNLKARFEVELGDLLAAVDFVSRHNDLDAAAIKRQRQAKLARYEEWHRDQQVVADRIAASFPPGFLEEVAAILVSNPHGVGPTESGGGQTLDDHLQHAINHLLVADNDLSKPGATVPRPDPDSGRSQFAHAAARCALARGLELTAEAARG